MPACITQWKHLMHALFYTIDCAEDIACMILTDHVLNEGNCYYI